jgi:hypothetical protein
MALDDQRYVLPWMRLSEYGKKRTAEQRSGER